MMFIAPGSKPYSYIINCFGLRIRFRNIFAFKNNKIIYIDKNGKERKFRKKGLKVIFKGANSTVRIFYPCPRFVNTTLVCGNNSNVTIGGSIFHIKNLFVSMECDDAELVIGENCFLRGGSIIFANKSGLKVSIGNNCLFASDVKIRTSDFHSIIDNTTNLPINIPQNVSIGNDCWLCEEVFISKGAVIPDNTVVASKAFVNKKFTKTNTVIGGVPAKVIKTNINWDTKGYEDYKKSLI